MLKRGINHVSPEHKGDALILEYVKISRRIGKYEEAEEVLKYGIEKTPIGEGLKILYIDYSNLLIWKNRHDEAISLLEKALQRLPRRSHSAIKRKMREIIEEKSKKPSKSTQSKDFGNQYFRKGEYTAPYLMLRKKLQSAKSNIVIIDPYINEEIIEIISILRKEVSILIISEKIKPSDFGVQINKLRRDGYNIKVFKTDHFHDRFLGVDDEWIHSGHSFKDIGSKSSMSSILDKDRIQKIKEDVEIVIKNTSEYC